MAAGIAAAFLALIFYAVMVATADDLRETIHTAASLGNPALAIGAGLILATISACATALAFVPGIRREIDAICVRN